MSESNAATAHYAHTLAGAGPAHWEPLYDHLRRVAEGDGDSLVGAAGFAGRATVSEPRRAYDRRGSRTAKPCRPGARSLCAKSCGDVAARPGARISNLQGDGGNSASLPGESSA